ncbi:MAG: hypothetical protein KIT77_28485 [Caldilinea sp.]|nr:hypothetical protein [Caldilineaceae bacterium]MCB0150558.1 hypothetical protein [Caldilineaceae bacterium]MCW5845226.1 hypothetical protein [Caldilinea sp.]
MDIAKLYELQKIDTNMLKVRRRVAQIRQQQGESDELTAARAAAAATQAEQEHLRAAELDAELLSEQLVERIHDAEQRLMSGTVRNPKELESLQASIEALKRQRAGAEEAAMTAFQRGEEVTARLAREQAALAEVERTWQAGQEELTQEENKLKRIYAQLKQQRQPVVDRLGAPAVELYEQLGTRKAGVAVASVKNGTCGACNVSLPTGVVSSARIEEGDPVYCPSCGRILYDA